MGKEGRASLNSVIDTVYHKVAMTLFSWLEAQGEKELEKFRCIARLGMISPLSLSFISFCFVYVFFVENFHHFSSQMMKRKVPTLEPYVKTAYDHFTHNLRSFANYLINRRFKPLIVRPPSSSLSPPLSSPPLPPPLLFLPPFADVFPRDG